MSRFLKSFHHAFSGIMLHWRIGKNFKIQVGIGTLIIIAGYFLKLSVIELISLLITIGIVLALETFNSALEVLCNIVSPDLHPQIKKVKDLSAGAVLVFCLFAVTIGCIIFVPKIFNYFIA